VARAATEQTRRTVITRLGAAAQSLRREFGFGLGALYIAHRLLQAFSRGHARIVPYALFAQPMGSPLLAAVRDDVANPVRALRPGDPLVAELPRPPAIIAARFARGSICHVAAVKGCFAGSLWLARGAYDEDEVRCRFVLGDAARSVWDFDVYVEPRFRFGRTLARLWKAVDQSLAAEGVEWSFSRISLFNPASATAHARLGALRVGTALFFVIGPVQFALHTQAPFVHLSLVASRRPSLTLWPPRPAGFAGR